MADELVTLATYFDPMTAALAKGHLEAAGIRAQLSGNAAASLFGGGIEPMKLLVLQSDFDHALEILGEPEPFPEDEEIAPPSEHFQSADRLHGMQGSSLVPQEEAATTAVTSTVPERIPHGASIQESPRPIDLSPSPEVGEPGQTNLDLRIKTPQANMLHLGVFIVLFGLAAVAVAVLATFR
jgi:hypothetical protein